MSLPEKTKRCCHCRLNKPLDQFHRNRKIKGGRDSRCKPCAKRYMQTREHPCEWCLTMTNAGRFCCKDHERRYKIAHAPCVTEATRKRISEKRKSLGPMVYGLLPPASCPQCQGKVRGTVDLMGRTAIECQKCGEFLVEPTGKRLHDQHDRLLKEMGSLNISGPADAKARKASEGRTARSIAKAGNFRVWGQAEWRKIRGAA